MTVEQVEFSIRLPKQLNNKLKQLAEREERSRNGQVVFILKQALDNYEKFLECVKSD